ncbi:MAG: hypothetical protein ACFNPZ_07920, partial [Fusobacterium polymorphum]
YRTERYGADSHRPEEITYADTLEEDVLRRDFTVNGMAMNRYGEVIEEEDLIVPHPYMEYREFVLKPLEEIIPNFVHPLLLKRVSTLKKELENENN